MSATFTLADAILAAQGWKDSGFPRSTALISMKQFGGDAEMAVQRVYDCTAVVELPVWETPTHEEVPLHELDPDALGLDPIFGSDDDVKLLDAIQRAKADPLPLVPQFLKSLPNWVTFQSKDNKAPIISGTTQKAKSNNPATWVKYQTALENIAAGKGYNNLGFVTDGANSGNLVGFDFDGCRNPETGELTAWAVRMLEALGATYGEVTVSGTGLRLWVIAPLGKNIEFKMGLAPLYYGKNQVLEIFGDGLYFTVSGNRLTGLPSEIRTLDEAEMGAVLAIAHELAVEKPKPPKTFTPDPDNGFRKLFDAIGWQPLIDRMNKMADIRFHNLEIDGGKIAYCPMPGHTPRSTGMKYTPCFGAMAKDPAAVHCFGCKFTGDLVKTVFEFDAGEDGGQMKYNNMYDCARVICTQYGLNFEEFFPPAKPAPTTTPEAEQTLQWSEVLPLDTILRPVLPFKEEYLPVAIRPWCKDVSERMSVPLDFTGVSAAICLFGVVGRRAFIYPKKNDKEWKEPLTASGGFVADSGTLKTPTWAAMRNPISELEVDWRREFAKSMEEFDKAHRAWEKQVEAAKKNKDIVAGDEPQKPLEPRRLVLNDATPEKMQSMMADAPQGLLYFRDELASWVSELDKEGRESQRGMYLAAMNGSDDWTIDRIGRGSVHALMSLSVGGNFQPGIFRKFLADSRNNEDGLTQRFNLLVWPDEVKRIRVDQRANKDAKQVYRNIVRILAKSEAESVWLHFDSEAQAVYDNWLDALYERMDREENDAKKSHLSKYSGGLARCAALFYIIDIAAGGGSVLGTYHIDKQHLQMAISFFSYLESHMHRVYDSAYTPAQEAETVVAVHIRKGEIPDGLSARDIGRKYRGLRELGSGAVEDALLNLADKNWVRRVIVPATSVGGRPSTKWQVNPAAKG